MKKKKHTKVEKYKLWNFILFALINSESEKKNDTYNE